MSTLSRGMVARILIRAAAAALLTCGSVFLLSRIDDESWYVDFGLWITVAGGVLTAEYLARVGELPLVRRDFFLLSAVSTFLAYWGDIEWAMRSTLALLSGGVASVLVRNRLENIASPPEDENPTLPGETQWEIVKITTCVIVAAVVWMAVVIMALSGETDGEVAAWGFAFSASAVKLFGVPAFVIWVSAVQRRDSPWRWGKFPAVLMLAVTAICLRYVFPWFGMFG